MSSRPVFSVRDPSDRENLAGEEEPRTGVLPKTAFEQPLLVFCRYAETAILNGNAQPPSVITLRVKIRFGGAVGC